MKLLKTKGWVRSALTALIGVGAAAPMYGSTIVVTYEPAGVQAANPAALCGTDTECWVGTEAFNSWNGNAPFATTFPTTDASIGGLTGGISGTYTGSLTRSNNVQYGGAGGTGYYATVTHSTYTLALTVSGGVPGVNYFGLWFSALDAGNELQFYDSGTLVYTFTPAMFMQLVGNCPGSAFCGNPNNGDDGSEQFAFLNFFDQGGYFDQIVFTETTNAGFESDNHTVAYMNPVTPSGTVIPGPAPEPGSFVLLSLGALSLLGLKRRRSARGC